MRLPKTTHQPLELVLGNSFPVPPRCQSAPPISAILVLPALPVTTDKSIARTEFRALLAVEAPRLRLEELRLTEDEAGCELRRAVPVKRGDRPRSCSATAPAVSCLGKSRGVAAWGGKPVLGGWRSKI